MKAIVFHGPKNITVEQMPDPKPGKGELLLRPEAVGVCYTDMLAHDTGPTPYYEPEVVIGHEGCGEVVGIGEGVEGWKVGDHVTVNPLIYCGKCMYCRMGDPGACLECGKVREAFKAIRGYYIGINAVRDDKKSLYHGLMADYCALPAYCCYRVPDNIDVLARANVEAFGISIHSIRRSGAKPGDNVVVLGLEDYNAMAVQYIPMSGSIVVVDPIEIRRKLAMRLGADVALDPSKIDVEAEILRLMPFGADMVLVSMEDYIDVSVTEYPNLAHRISRIGGTIMYLRQQPIRGNIGDEKGVSFPMGVTLKMPGVFSQYLSEGGIARSDFQMVIDGLAKGKIDGVRHVSRVIPFKDINSTSDVKEMLARYPEKETKMVITM